MWARIRSGATEFSHENGLSRLAIQIGANTRHATVTTSTPLDASTVCAQPRGTPNGTLSNNQCFVHTVQADDLDEDGISIGPGAPGPNGVTIGDDRGSDHHADLRASDNMALAGHAITNDRARRVDGSLTEHPPANAIGIHPGIIGVSVVALAYDDTFYPGERISVAVRHNRSVRVSGHGVPVLTLDVRGNLRTARFDQARFLAEQVFVGTGDENRRPGEPPSAPTVLYSGAERLRFSYAVRADDLGADGISIPANGLGTPNSKVIVAGDGSGWAIRSRALCPRAIRAGPADTGDRLSDGRAARVSRARRKGIGAREGWRISTGDPPRGRATGKVGYHCGHGPREKKPVQARRRGDPTAPGGAQGCGA